MTKKIDHSKLKLLIGNALVIGYKKGHTGNIAHEIAEKATQKETEDLTAAIYDLLVEEPEPGIARQRAVEYIEQKKTYVQYYDTEMGRWRPRTDKDGKGIVTGTPQEAEEFIKNNPMVLGYIIHEF